MRKSKRVTRTNLKALDAHAPGPNEYIDAPELTDEQLASGWIEIGGKPVGGRPKLANPKRAIKLRLDGEVIDRFRARGPGWQTDMNNALRKAAGLKVAKR